MKKYAAIIVIVSQFIVTAISYADFEKYTPAGTVPVPASTVSVQQPQQPQQQSQTQAQPKSSAEFKKFDIGNKPHPKKHLSAIVPKKRKTKKAKKPAQTAKNETIRTEKTIIPTSTNNYFTGNEPPKFIDIQAILAKAKTVEVDEKKVKSQAEQIEKATQKPDDAIKVAANNVYTFIDGSIYTIWCKKGFITDIQLQPGERVSEQPLGGDTKRWTVDSAVSGGNGSQEIEHVYVRPIEDDIVTNIVISTDRRSYHIKAVATEKTFTPLVSWVYPSDAKRELAFAYKLREKEKAEVTTDEPIAPEKMYFEYTIKSNKGMWASEYNWTPVRAFNDGSKTYLQVNPQMKNNESPPLFIKDRDGKLNLVNYRLKNNYFIIDRLFDEAELRNGTDEIVTITRETKQ